MGAELDLRHQPEDEHRRRLFETLSEADPGETVEFGFGTQTAHGTDEYTTTEALVRNVTAYALLPVAYGRQVADQT